MAAGTRPKSDADPRHRHAEDVVEVDTLVGKGESGGGT